MENEENIEGEQPIVPESGGDPFEISSNGTLPGGENPDDRPEAADEGTQDAAETSGTTEFDDAVEDEEDELDAAEEPGTPSAEQDSEPDTAVATDAPIEVPAELAAEVEEALEGVEPDEEAEPLPEWVPGDWYVVHTYAGYENKVKADLETRVSSMNMEESIYEIVIPMEDVVEVKNGKKQTVQRKVFPGYLLVRMDLNDDSWYVVRNTPGVTGFVGSANKPIPLSEREVDKILRRKEEAEKPKSKAEWTITDAVRVTSGPFANFQGNISEVDEERQKVKVLVNIFGRETPVELSYDQISKV